MTSIRRLEDHQLSVIQPLFNEVFRHPISLDLLRWKYGGNNGESWIVEEEAGNLKPLVHCGVFYRDILYWGNKARAAQVVDIIAAPKTRGLTRYDSPFGRLLRTILSNETSPANPAGIAFGFPSGRAGRLTEYVGAGKAVDQLYELEFHPDQHKSGLRYRSIKTLTPPEAAQLETLWSAMRKDLEDFAVGIHDTAYIQKRYINHPENAYTLLLFESRWFRRTVGFAVIGPGNERRELLDIVCALRHIPEIISALQTWQKETATNALHLSLTHHFTELLRPLAVRCEPTQFRILCNPFTPPDCLASFENRWWLTGGDTDYR